MIVEKVKSKLQQEVEELFADPKRLKRFCYIGSTYEEEEKEMKMMKRYQNRCQI